MEHSQFTRLALGSILLASLFISFNLSAEQTTTVFKVINPDGSVSFSDKAQQNAEELHIKPVPTVPAFTVFPKDSKSNSSTTSKTTKEGSSHAYYSVNISSPANDSAFYSGSGDVDIVVDLVPALFKGDQIEFQVDGATLATQTSPQYTLKTLNRGTHKLNINILNSTGEVLKNATSSFTVHRPIKRH